MKKHFSGPSKSKIDTALVIDADKTLSASDAGKMFCDMVEGYVGALGRIFGGELEYKPAAFYQAMLMSEQAVGAKE